MGAASVSLLVLAPVIGMLVFTFRYALGSKPARRWRRDAITPSLAVAALAAPVLARGQTTDGLIWLGQAVLVFVAVHVLRAERHELQAGLILALAVTTFSVHFVDWARPRSWGWIDSPVNALQGTRHWPPLRLGREDVTDMAELRWRVPHRADRLMLNVEYSVSGAGQAWDWRSATQASALSRHGSSDDVTEYAPSGTSPFVFKRGVHHRPVGGLLLRASLIARFLEEPSTCGRLNIAVPGGTPFHHTPMCLASTWQRFELTWRVPETVPDHRIDIVINGVRDGVVLIRDASIEVEHAGHWHAISPLIPEVAWLEISVDQGGDAAVQRSDIPLPEGSVWERLVVPVDASAGSLVTARVHAPRGGGVQLRGATLMGGEPLPSDRGHRARLWFNHPNTTGHAIATATLVALAASGPGLLSPAIGIAGVATIAETGSRIALGVTAIMLMGLVSWWSRSRTRTVGFGGLAVLGILIVAVALFAPVGFRLAEGDVGLGDRVVIWRLAAEAIRESPLVGAKEAFTSLSLGAVGTSVSHAHNLYLQLAYQSGAIGVVAAIVLLATLMRASWHRHGGAGVIIVSAVAGALQIFDVTLFSASVLLPLLLFAFGTRTQESHQGQAKGCP